MKKSGVSFFIAACMLSSSSLVVAGEFEIGVAKGMMIYSVVQEKCTGVAYSKNHMAAQYKYLRSHGFSVKDIEVGFNEGFIEGSAAYLKEKPTREECKSAKEMFGGTTGYVPK